MVNLAAVIDKPTVVGDRARKCGFVQEDRMRDALLMAVLSTDNI